MGTWVPFGYLPHIRLCVCLCVSMYVCDSKMVLEDTGKWGHSEPEPPLLGINPRASECLHVSEQNEDKWQGVPHTPPPCRQVDAGV